MRRFLDFGGPALLALLAVLSGCAHEENDPRRPATITQTAGVVVRHGVAYESVPETMKLDLYLPHVPAGRRVPLVLVIHGGGWMHGGRNDFREVEIGTTLAEAGYVAASVSYHLGTTKESGWWPRNLLDCKTAIRFLRVHAAEYGIDPARVGVLGESAGGHLALMVGFTTDVPSLEPTAMPGVSDRVTSVVSMYGITDLLTRQGTNPDGTPTGRFHDSNAARMLGYTSGLYPALWQSASPVTYVRKGVPPVLIIHGLKDPVVDHNQASELNAEMTAAGAESTLILLKGVPHSFDLQGLETKKPLPVDLRPIVVAFFRRTLGE